MTPSLKGNMKGFRAVQKIVSLKYKCMSLFNRVVCWFIQKIEKSYTVMLHQF